MLLELRVKDLGIIEDLNWQLESGLNVITGATGAGKSLIIDAVELLLTGSASSDVIRFGASEARIEGVFALSVDPRFDRLKLVLAETGISQEEDTLVISCEVRKQKPTLIRINGHTITRSNLRRISQLLIDIHGQSEHLSLLDNNSHLEFVDAFAHAGNLRKNLSEKVARFSSY